MAEKISLLRLISKKLDRISIQMEKLKMTEYINYLEHPKRMLVANFVGGLARGFGIAVGFSLLGALAIYFLQLAIRLNLPFVSRFINDLINIVRTNATPKG